MIVGNCLKIAELCEMMQEEYAIAYTCRTNDDDYVVERKVWSCKCGCCGEESEVCVRKRLNSLEFH